jgi:membrane protein DedA with SNARE-associated domain
MESVLAWVSHYGYAGLFGLLVLGILGLPIPDETLLMFSGYLIYRGRFHPALAFVTGFGGSCCGISLSYTIGRTLGYGFVHRYGRYVRLTEPRINGIKAWFHRIGHWLLTIGYFIPGVRHFTALVAGLSHLEYRTFAVFAYSGAAIWVATFLSIGYFVGEAWQSVSKLTERYALLVAFAGAALAATVWWIRQRYRKRTGVTN